MNTMIANKQFLNVLLLFLLRNVEVHVWVDSVQKHKKLSKTHYRSYLMHKFQNNYFALLTIAY